MTAVELGILADLSYALRVRFCSEERLLQELRECEKALSEKAGGCCSDARDACDRLEITYSELRRRHPERAQAHGY